ncbi:hypothetical protein CYMTET_25887, partial [Cymbomonas tetramitiformis]
GVRKGREGLLSMNVSLVASLVAGAGQDAGKNRWFAMDVLLLVASVDGEHFVAQGGIHTLILGSMQGEEAPTGTVVAALLTVAMLLGTPNMRTISGSPTLCLAPLLSPVLVESISLLEKSDNREQEAALEKQVISQLRRSCAQIIVLARTWSGITLLAVQAVEKHKHSAFQMLVEGLLRTTHVQVLEALLAMFFELLLLPVPPTLQKTKDDDLPLRRQTRAASAKEKSAAARPPVSQRGSLMSTVYLGVLMQALQGAGLHDALHRVATLDPHEFSSHIPRCGTLLLAEYITLMENVLPPQCCGNVHDMQALVSTALPAQQALRGLRVKKGLLGQSQGGLHEEEHGQSRAMQVINTLHTFTLRAGSTTMEAMPSLALEHIVRAGEEQASNTKLGAVESLEDAELNLMLKNSGVMDYRHAKARGGEVAVGTDGATICYSSRSGARVESNEWEKWHLPSIAQFVGGPMHLPGVVKWLCKQGKFMKRLAAFFTKRFHSLPRSSQEGITATQIFHDFVRALMSTEDGLNFLAGGGKDYKACSLLPDLSAAFQLELGPETRSLKGRLFHELSLAETVSSAYLDTVGLISSSAAGLCLLDKFSICQSLKQCLNIAKRSDLHDQILTKLDYRVAGGSPRTVLSAALESSVSTVRNCALAQARHLLLSSVRSASNLLMKKRDRRGTTYQASEEVEKITSEQIKWLSDTARWVIGLLLDHLEVFSEGEGRTANAILRASCVYPLAVDLLVGLKRSIEELTCCGPELALTLMNSAAGYDYLQEHCGVWMSGEIKRWDSGNGLVEYVTQVDLLSVKLATMEGLQAATTQQLTLLTLSRLDNMMPPHLYGALAATAAGCKALSNSPQLSAWSKCLLEDDWGCLVEQRAAAWALGHVAGASERGADMVIEMGGVRALVMRAECNPYLALRGSCIYALSLAARSQTCRTHLEGIGWYTKMYMHQGQELAVCLPLDINRIFRIASEKVISVVRNWRHRQQIRDSMIITTNALPSKSKKRIEMPHNQPFRKSLTLRDPRLQVGAQLSAVDPARAKRGAGGRWEVRSTGV